MKATSENLATLNNVIKNLQSQIDELYASTWNNEKSVKEESLQEMIWLIAEERNNIELELRNDENYYHSYINSQN